MDIDNFEVFTNRLKALDIRIKEAYEKSCKGDWSCLEDIKVVRDLGGYYMEFAISESLMRNLISYNTKTEKDVYEWFRDNFQTVLGKEYQIVSKKESPKCSKHQPDMWVINKDGEMIPIECKLKDFNKRSLKQLERYMEYFETKHGIAVGSELKCELPENIKFIKHGVGDAS